MKRVIIALLATTIVVAAPSATHPARADEPVTLRIGYLRGTEPLNVSRIRGTLEARLAAQNVRVTWVGPFGAFAPAAEAVQANAVDLTVGSSTAAISAITGNLPIQIFAFQKTPGDAEGIIVPADSPIKSTRDLIGRTVAVNRGGSGDYLLSKALENDGVPEDSVKRAYLDPVDSAQAFNAGHVDAWAAWSVAYPTALLQYHARPIATAGRVHSENAVVYVVRTELARAHPEIVAAVLADLRSSNQWLVHNRDQAAQIWIDQLKFDPIVAKAIAAEDTTDPALVTPAERLEFQHTASWMLARKIIPQAASIDDHIWTAPK
jgi:sulfonate transport system substrate-binding protein